MSDEIGNGDLVPESPASASVARGLLTQLFKGPCGNLHEDPANTSGVARKLMRADQVATYTAWLNAQGWDVANKDTFAKAGFLPRLRLSRIMCPWFQHDGLNFGVNVFYSEQGIDNPAPLKVMTGLVWPKGQTTVEMVVQGNDVAGPSPGYDGHSLQARIKLEAVKDPVSCNTILNFYASLISGGWDFLAGQTVDQQSLGFPGCGSFVGGEAGAFFAWTAVGPFGSPPLPIEVPLVRGLQVVIYGGLGFTG